nr:uncharacterized protein LOC123763666 [Procambarus clarkii]XP_045606893.1 uncharacterized protein LOC123763666 [Procambarus clarkii]XP_045606894.1 uncharacterized protein LOC123763666 [Procambarus clarkii]XP_045606895.1 uncharacterized protein LOC123763666 [Procambarus clarkii]XP_045606897.1 uncharacterized protein LOC123763666 [Procambarus clarkii]XP_045606898.1 uncharacterized protein LOC123763666 [Procambarus clarkii]XP_045606899.1 uncharacterized protein LOC123763666 [Procambarus clarki
MSRNKKAARRRGAIFASFFMCCLGASLLAAAMATKNWFESDCKSPIPSSTGHVNFGLFEGRSRLQSIASITHDLKVVCEDGSCMYSCAATKALRIDHLNLVKNHTEQSSFVNEHCQSPKALRSRPSLEFLPALSGQSPGEETDPRRLLFSPMALDFLLRRWHSFVDMPLADITVADSTENSSTDDAAATTPDEATATTTPDVTTPVATTTTPVAITTTPVAESSTLETSTSQTPVDQLEFMDYGLWMGTIVCLSLGMLFAVVGALFAVINTATTPVEAITGVPGLYLWNALAALFNIICVILWAVQFHQHLSGNVLLYDAQDGWTTDGMGVYGYSYWLVVVAIFVHVVNIGIIFMGTHEPKVKEQLQAPDAKGGIMLY